MNRQVEVYLRRPVPMGHPTHARVLETAERSRRDVPPRVPAELDELEEAMMLLGAYVNGQGIRKPTARDLLRALIGALPLDASEAAAWKTAIKKRRRVLLERERSLSATAPAPTR